MASITRGTKTVGGGTDFVSGTILTSEVNTDLNTIVNDYNGNITNANISASAAIEASKLDGYSDSATEMATEMTPGVTGGTSAATTMQAELERLRYKIKERNLGVAAARLDATAGVDLISWFDTPAVGPNLVRNGLFAVKTASGGTSAPDGWTAVGPAAAYSIAFIGTTEGTPNLSITCNASAANGISQTFANLKPSTKYLVSARLITSTGTSRLVTTGAAAGTFDNLDISYTTNAWATVSGVIATDATPTSIVVSILGSSDATADVFGVTKVELRECSANGAPMSDTPWAQHTITAGLAISSTVFTDSTLTCSVITPGPGYTIEVVAKISILETVDSGGVASLRENGTEVDSAYWTIDSTIERGVVRFDYVKTHPTPPTPGTTYTYTVFLRGDGISSPAVNGAALGTETVNSWIRCRAVLESGGH